MAAEQQQAGYDQGQADAQQAAAAAPAPVAAAPEYAPAPAAPAPPPPDPYDQIEHLAALHASGALTDEEFAAEKAKVLAS